MTAEAVQSGRAPVLVLGGSFDPVHRAHVELGRMFLQVFTGAQLRVMPADCPWQKGKLQAGIDARCAMLKLAFAAQGVPMELDLREVGRDQHCYTVDSLRSLRAEIGPQACLIFVLGADQLQQFHTWHAWREIFDLAHIAVGSRPGFSFARPALEQEVAAEFTRRARSAGEILTGSAGGSYLCGELALDMSATQIRGLIKEGKKVGDLLAPQVLDYIQLHHLYQK